MTPVRWCPKMPGCVLEPGHTEICAASFLEARLMKDLEAARVRVALERGLSAGYKAQRDRLAAVLADTPENVAAIHAKLGRSLNWNEVIATVLADQRERAGQP